MHRYLNHSDFRLVYTVLLNWNDLPRAPGLPDAAAGRKPEAGRRGR